MDKRVDEWAKVEIHQMDGRINGWIDGAADKWKHRYEDKCEQFKANKLPS